MTSSSTPVLLAEGAEEFGSTDVLTLFLDVGTVAGVQFWLAQRFHLKKKKFEVIGFMGSGF